VRGPLATEAAPAAPPSQEDTAVSNTNRPVPRDPRTPFQAAQARLVAANRRLRTTYLPRTQRQELADQIIALRADVDRLTLADPNVDMVAA